VQGDLLGVVPSPDWNRSGAVPPGAACDIIVTNVDNSSGDMLREMVKNKVREVLKIITIHPSFIFSLLFRATANKQTKQANKN
jgi:hypothetical protein